MQTVPFTARCYFSHYFPTVDYESEVFWLLPKHYCHYTENILSLPKHGMFFFKKYSCYFSHYFPTVANESEVSHIYRKWLTSALKNKVDIISDWLEHWFRNLQNLVMAILQNWCKLLSHNQKNAFKYSNLRWLLSSFYYLLKPTIIFKILVSLIYIYNHNLLGTFNWEVAVLNPNP